MKRGYETGVGRASSWPLSPVFGNPCTHRFKPRFKPRFKHRFKPVSNQIDDAKTRYVSYRFKGFQPVSNPFQTPFQRPFHTPFHTPVHKLLQACYFSQSLLCTHLDDGRELELELELELLELESDSKLAVKHSFILCIFCFRLAVCFSRWSQSCIILRIHWLTVRPTFSRNTSNESQRCRKMAGLGMSGGMKRQRKNVGQNTTKSQLGMPGYETVQIAMKLL